MAGAIIENMSTKKLCIVGGILLVFQIIAFLVGGLIAPGPTTAVSYMSVKCVDTHKNHHKTKWLMPWGPNQCDKIRDFNEAITKEIQANDIVFSVHIPLPAMEMSPWFQFMLFILQLDIAFKLNNQIRENAEVSMDVSLAYRDDSLAEWTEMAHERVPRKLKCTFTSPKMYKEFHWLVASTTFDLSRDKMEGEVRRELRTTQHQERSTRGRVHPLDPWPLHRNKSIKQGNLEYEDLLMEPTKRESVPLELPP